jgi:hypothetical protein
MTESDSQLAFVKIVSACLRRNVNVADILSSVGGADLSALNIDEFAG